MQAGVARISGGDFGFTVGVGDADIADLKMALCFGNGDFWRNNAGGNLLTASQAGLSLKYNRQPQCGNNACRYDVYGRMVQKPGPEIRDTG